MTASTTQDLKGALAKRPAFDPSSVDMKKTQPIGTIRQLIDSQRSELARALPKHMDADRLARIAFTTIRSTPALANCTPESLLGALMTCGQLGLEPGPLGHAYFVPMGREVTFILGYKGMIALAQNSGQIKSLIAREVYANDTFDVNYGLEDALVHKPEILGDRGNVVAYYAVAKYASGGHAFVVLSRSDVEKYRKKSKQPNGPMWRDDYDAAAKKTCIRRLFTYLPASIEMAQAMGQDGQVRTSVDPDALDEAPNYADGSIDGQVIDTPDAGRVTESTGEVHNTPAASHDIQSADVVIDAHVVTDVAQADQQEPDPPAWEDLDVAQPGSKGGRR